MVNKGFVKIFTPAVKLPTRSVHKVAREFEIIFKILLFFYFDSGLVILVFFLSNATNVFNFWTETILQ